VNRVGRFLETSNVAAAASLAEPCLRQLRKDNRRAELASLCERLAGSVPRDNFDVWLPVVASWAYLGQPERAEEVLEKARGLVFGGRQKKPPDTRFPVGKLYVAAVALQPGDIARGRLEELFDRMQDVRDTFNTARYFALNHFRVIDAVILAVV